MAALLSRPIRRAIAIGLAIICSAPGVLSADPEPPSDSPAAAVRENPAGEKPAGLGASVPTGGPHPHGFRQIGVDAKYLVTRPLHLDRDGKIKIALTVGTAGALFLLRNRIRGKAQEDRSDARDQFLQKPRIMGKAAFAPSLSLIAYGASFLTRDDREKETAVLLLESMAFTGVGVGLGQFVLSSQRPEEGKEVRFFRWGGHGISGDAGLAASVVPVLRRQYLTVHPEDGTTLRFWKRSATGILYAGAALTVYQRINNDKHWAPDAFLGMVTGLTVGETLCDSHDSSRQEKRTHLSLEASPSGVGLRVRF